LWQPTGFFWKKPAGAYGQLLPVIAAGRSLRSETMISVRRPAFFQYKKNK